MKVYPEQLDNALNGALSSIYIVSGDEPLLVTEACDKIRSAANAQGFSEKKIRFVETGFDWNSLSASSQSLSLFSDKQFTELRMPNGKPGKEGGKILQIYTENPPNDTILLIITNKLDSATQKTKWFKSLENAGVFVQIWPIDTEKLPQWISNRMQKNGISTTRDGLHLIVDRVEGNLLAAHQEIEKLRLLYGEGELSLEQIEEAIVNNARFNAFELVDCALKGDANKIPKILTALQQEGAEPILILWAITREMRMLAEITYEFERGKPAESLFSRFRVWPKRKSIVISAMNRHPSKRWLKLLSRGTFIDKMIKGLEPGNVWDELLRLCLLMAGKNIFSKIRVQKA